MQIEDILVLWTFLSFSYARIETNNHTTFILALLDCY